MERLTENKNIGLPKKINRRFDMTICIATICDGGEHIIMMTDAMITGKHLSIEFEHKRPKITIMANNCAVATAGDALAHTELFEEVREEIDKLKRPKVSNVVKCIKECFVKLRQKEIMERILNPRGITYQYFLRG